MVKLRVDYAGNTKVTEHETWPAAHHALVYSLRGYGLNARFDLDVIKGTISGKIVSGDPRNEHGSSVWGSFLMGETS